MVAVHLNTYHQRSFAPNNYVYPLNSSVCVSVRGMVWWSGWSVMPMKSERPTSNIWNWLRHRTLECGVELAVCEELGFVMWLVIDRQGLTVGERKGAKWSGYRLVLLWSDVMCASVLDLTRTWVHLHLNDTFQIAEQTALDGGWKVRVT